MPNEEDVSRILVRRRLAPNGRSRGHRNGARALARVRHSIGCVVVYRLETDLAWNKEQEGLWIEFEQRWTFIEK